MTDPLQRVCFVMQLRPDRVDDYLAAHEVVWPEMLDALSAAGWQNYSLFLRPEDGMVVGYLETPDFALATAQIERTAVNEKWQAQMSQYFQPPPGDRDADPDAIRHPLVEYFHLP